MRGTMSDVNNEERQNSTHFPTGLEKENEEIKRNGRKEVCSE